MDPAKLEKLFEQQLKLMEMLTQANISFRVPSIPEIPQSVDGITSGVTEFLYDSDANITFDTWFRRYEDLFKLTFPTEMMLGRCASSFENLVRRSWTSIATSFYRRTHVIVPSTKLFDPSVNYLAIIAHYSILVIAALNWS